MLGVEAGPPEPPRSKTKPASVCSACGYDLRSLPVGRCMEVVCPECGVTNLPPELPRLSALRDRRLGWRRHRGLSMMFIVTVAVVFGVMMLLSWIL